MNQSLPYYRETHKVQSKNGKIDHRKFVSKNRVLMRRAVAYYRDSTDKQKRSGLGVGAQKRDVHYFKLLHKLELEKEFRETESGRRSNNRPVLLRALQYCRENNTLLVIAKLCRLARNVAFVSALMESDVEFVAVDMPFANKLMLHIMAAFAEHERDMISIRTKQALSIAKDKGVRLGALSHKRKGTNSRNADKYALKMLPRLNDLQKDGITTIRGIAAALTIKRIKTYRGLRKWHKNTVCNIILRLRAIRQRKQQKTLPLYKPFSISKSQYLLIQQLICLYERNARIPVRKTNHY